MSVVGLVGCGAWGSNILRDLTKLDCQVYVVDIDFQARSKAQACGALKVFPEITDLPDCDGYVVAVPIPDLTKVCASLLKYKKPIFSEKTLCLSLEDFQLLNNSGGSDYIFAMHKGQHNFFRIIRAPVSYYPGFKIFKILIQKTFKRIIKRFATIICCNYYGYFRVIIHGKSKLSGVAKKVLYGQGYL
jgi:hypothetical protein